MNCKEESMKNILKRNDLTKEKNRKKMFSLRINNLKDCEGK